jgi:dienelactone hydrolase
MARRYRSSSWPIAFARSLAGVHADGIVTFGSSIGGGNALAAAAEDSRVAAAISQVPFLDLRTQSLRPPPDVVAGIRSAAERDEFLPAVGQPSEPAPINAPNSEAGWRHVVAGSSAPTQASTTSTSTTAQNTRRSSQTRRLWSAVCRHFLRVSDGTRTRDRLDHNRRDGVLAGWYSASQSGSGSSQELRLLLTLDP